MTNEQKQVKDWMTAFGQECPDKPVIPSLEVRRLRAKLILEEALETILALGITDVYDNHGCICDFEELLVSINLPNDVVYVHNNRPNLTEIADGCEDLKVVTEGTLVACGLIKPGFVTFLNSKVPADPLFDEVMRSNWSKMWKESEIDDTVIATHKVKCLDGKPGRHIVKTDDGKVIKSPSYSPPNLVPIINEL